MSIFNKIDKRVILSRHDILLIPAKKIVKYSLVLFCLFCGLWAVYISL